MNTNKQRAWFLILFTLVLCSFLSERVEAQEAKASIRERFTFLPAYRQCHPAEVRGFAFGNQPPEVLLAQVIIGNRSSQTMTAVKLGWKVYRFADGIRIVTSPCDAPPRPAAEALLSGNTQLIQLTALAPNETSNLSTNPLIVALPATKTVFVDQPFLTADDVKSLIPEATRKLEKYMVIMYVSEINYDDGTTWKSGK